MENLNRVLLENVLPAHVAEHFLARNLKNEVSHPCIYILCSVRKRILEISLNADLNSRSIQRDYRFGVTFIPPYLPERLALQH